MGLFSKKSTGTPYKELVNFHGKRLSYVVERFGGEEETLGKEGGISVKEDRMVIVCNGHEVARLSTKNLICAELMSHNGCDIKGTDLENGRQRHLVAHYSNFK